MNRGLITFLGGLLVGGAVAAVLFVALGSGGKPAPADETTVAESRQEEGLRSELEAVTRDRDALRREVEELKSRPAESAEMESPDGRPVPGTEIAPEVAGEPATGLTDEALEKALQGLGNHIQGLILGSSDEFKKQVRSILERGGPGTVDRILKHYEEAEGLGPKTVLAHTLAQTGDPRAIAALQEIVRDPEADMFHRRAASHGLAFSDEEGLEEYYREVIGNPEIELGARANSAFGLARRNDEGVAAYAKTVDEAFERKDPLALGYVQGFLFIGKRAVPEAEKRLKTLKDPQARMILIAVLEGHGSKDSIPALRALAADPSCDEGTRVRAEKAAEKLAQRE
jgi:hypothetical protein